MKEIKVSPRLVFVSAGCRLDQSIAEYVAHAIRSHAAPDVRRPQVLKNITADVVVDYLADVFKIYAVINSIKALTTSDNPVAAEFTVHNRMSNEVLVFWLNVAKSYNVPSQLTALCNALMAPVQLSDGSLVVVIPSDLHGSRKAKSAKDLLTDVNWYEPDLSLRLTSEEGLFISSVYKSTLAPVAPRSAEDLHLLVDPMDLNYYESSENVALQAGVHLGKFYSISSILEYKWSTDKKPLKADDLLSSCEFGRRVRLVSESDDMEFIQARDWWMTSFLEG